MPKHFIWKYRDHRIELCIYTIPNAETTSDVGRYSPCKRPQTCKRPKLNKTRDFFLAILHTELYCKNTTQCWRHIWSRDFPRPTLFRQWRTLVESLTTATATTPSLFPSAPPSLSTHSRKLCGVQHTLQFHRCHGSLGQSCSRCGLALWRAPLSPTVPQGQCIRPIRLGKVWGCWTDHSWDWYDNVCWWGCGWGQCGVWGLGWGKSCYVGRRVFTGCVDTLPRVLYSLCWGLYRQSHTNTRNLKLFMHKTSNSWEQKKSTQSLLNT